MGVTTKYLLTPLSFLRHPAACASGLSRGRTYLYRFCHDTWETYTTDVLLNTNLSHNIFILLLPLKYVKLRAVVVLKIINVPSSLVRGLQHIFIFSSHINSTWWKAIQIIKCVFNLFCFNLCRRICRFSGSSHFSGLEESRFPPQHQPMR